MTNVCTHGSLKRKCPICERDEEIAELKAQVERLRAALVRAVEWGAPMAEAPRANRPEWFDIARAALSDHCDHGIPRRFCTAVHS